MRVLTPFTLVELVTESNRIEGLGVAQPHEIAAHEELLCAPSLTVSLLQAFVNVVARAALRDSHGMNVRVGRHVPPRGGPEIRRNLDLLLDAISHQRLSPWEAHVEYETLHPFMDGNGRSGRAVWLWQMGGIDKVPLGFLHSWYYQSLDASR